jgi:hypothetical protein
MTDVTSLFLPAKLLEASQADQYTAPGLAVIDAAIVTNTGAGNSSLSVNLVEPGGGASSANLAIAARLIAPGETYLCPELIGQALAAGGVISTLSGGGLVMRITGRLIG